MPVLNEIAETAQLPEILSLMMKRVMIGDTSIEDIALLDYLNRVSPEYLKRELYPRIPGLREFWTDNLPKSLDIRPKQFAELFRDKDVISSFNVANRSTEVIIDRSGTLMAVSAAHNNVPDDPTVEEGRMRHLRIYRRAAPGAVWALAAETILDFRTLPQDYQIELGDEDEDDEEGGYFYTHLDKMVFSEDSSRIYLRLKTTIMEMPSIIFEYNTETLAELRRFISPEHQRKPAGNVGLEGLPLTEPMFIDDRACCLYYTVERTRRYLRMAMFDLKTGATTFRILKGVYDPNYQVQLFPTPDGQRIVVRPTNGGDLILYDLRESSGGRRSRKVSVRGGTTPSPVNGIRAKWNAKAALPAMGYTDRAIQLLHFQEPRFHPTKPVCVFRGIEIYNSRSIIYVWDYAKNTLHEIPISFDNPIVRPRGPSETEANRLTLNRSFASFSSDFAIFNLAFSSDGDYLQVFVENQKQGAEDKIRLYVMHFQSYYIRRDDPDYLPVVYRVNPLTQQKKYRAGFTPTPPDLAAYRFYILAAAMHKKELALVNYYFVSANRNTPTPGAAEMKAQRERGMRYDLLTYDVLPQAKTRTPRRQPASA